jgi:hypothetical protein
MVGLDGGEAPTAVFFHEQTARALADAILAFEAAADRFDPVALRARAARFDRPLFRERLREYVESRWLEFRGRRPC